MGFLGKYISSGVMTPEEKEANAKEVFEANIEWIEKCNTMVAVAAIKQRRAVRYQQRCAGMRWIRRKCV